MPAGLELYDASGRLIVGVGDDVFKFVGSVYINSGSNPSGSVSDDRLYNGLPDGWFVGDSYYNYGPAISVSGNTVSWSNPYPGYAWSGYIHFGFW